MENNLSLVKDKFKEMPNNIEAEQAVIGSILVTNEIFDEIRDLLSGLLAPTEKEKFLGYATIKQVFKITKVGKIAGCLVSEGIIKKNTKLRILRDNVVIHSGDLDKLKRVCEIREKIAIKKNIPTTIAVNPVLPPASTPAELST